MKKNYFYVASLFLLLLSVIAFSDNLFWDIGQESNRDPIFIIHGIFMFAWFILLVVQTQLIRKDDFKAHMKWGVVGMFIAIGVFVSTLVVFYSVFESWEAMAFQVKVNRFFMLSYAILIALGYRFRKNAALHKRYIYLATLYMLLPILDRASGHLSLNVYIFLPVVWNGFFISLFLYDWKVLSKIHAISLGGFVWFYIVWTISMLS